MLDEVLQIKRRGLITLERARWTIPDELPFGDERLVPLDAGGALNWKLVD